MTARAVSSPMDPVPSFDSTANGFITDVLSSLCNKNIFEATDKSLLGILLKPGPSYLSRLDSMYTVCVFNHSLYGSLSLRPSSICFSSIIKPVKVFIARIPPGDTLPFLIIF